MYLVLTQNIQLWHGWRRGVLKDKIIKYNDSAQCRYYISNLVQFRSRNVKNKYTQKGTSPPFSLLPLNNKKQSHLHVNSYKYIFIFTYPKKKIVAVHANIMEANNIFKPQDWPSILYKECLRHKNLPHNHQNSQNISQIFKLHSNMRGYHKQMKNETYTPVHQ